MTSPDRQSIANMPGAATAGAEPSVHARRVAVAPSLISDADNRPTPLWIVIAYTVVAVAGMAWLRLYLFRDRITPIGFGVPLVGFVWLRNRTWLWICAGTFAAMIAVKFYYVLPHSHADTMWLREPNVAATLTLFDLVLIAGGAHMLIAAHDRRRRAMHELTASNAEIIAHEEEIARQNEELQSQTEELERQSEELRISNDELSRREKMLEALLSLSRSLAVANDRGETMDKICRTLGELINGPTTAAAIVERRGDEVRVTCHHGFSGGLQRTSWPYAESFASLVLDRDRTGYLDDIALRPELTIAQPKSGPPMRSVLAAPLRVGGRAVGSVEVYHIDKHAWTDEQITLIESLAAQTSISLEATEMFGRIEDERKRLRTVLETVPFGVAISDERGENLSFNPAAAAMLNVPSNAIIDRLESSRWKVYRGGKVLLPEERPLARALHLGHEIDPEELEIVFANGRRITILCSAAPIHDRQGNATGCVAAWADISPLKKLQAELDARRREAEESSTRKSRFLAAVSHDIRTPANAISLLAELMQRTAMNPSMSHEIPGIADDLKRSALTLVDLVSDVLDLTRFESGRLDLQETDVALHDLIVDESRQFAQSAKEKGLDFICEPPPATLVIRTDRVKLSRILANLITNAIKYTDSGRVHVSAGWPDHDPLTRRRVGAINDDDKNGSNGDNQSSDAGVVIRVKDTGAGIPAEHHQRIFDEFFQLKHVAHGRGGGSGLGLAICRRLVEAMGGSITVESEVGRGSTFTVLLPAERVVPTNVIT